MRRRPAAVGGLLGVLAFVGFFGRALSPAMLLDRRDALALYLPLKAFFVRELQHGHFPTWLSLGGAGLSLIGTTAGVFDPSNVLYLFLAPDQGLKWQALLAYVLAAVGAGALAREVGARSARAWVAGLGYALSGYLLSMSDNLPYLEGAAMLPWTLWAAERLAGAPSARRAGVLAITLALTLTTGDVQALTLQVELLPLLFLAHGTRGSRPRWIWGGAALALLGLLGAPIWGPLAATAIESGRVSGALDAPLAWSFEPARLFELLYGQPYPPEYFRLGSAIAPRYLGGYMNGVWAVSEHLGLTVVVLAAVAVLGRARRRTRWFYGGLSAIGLLLAAGAKGGLYPVLYRVLPLWRAFRYPEKLMPLPLLGLCVLAGCAAHRLGHRDPRTARVLGAATLLTLALLAVVAGGGVAPALHALDAQGQIADPEVVATVTRWAEQQLGLGLAGLAALGALWRWRSRAAAPVAALLVWFQALPVGAWAFHVAPRSVLERPVPFLASAQAQLGDTLGRYCYRVDQVQFADDPEDALDPASAVRLRTLSPDHGLRLGLAQGTTAAPGLSGDLARLCTHSAECPSPCSRMIAARLGIVSEHRYDSVLAAQGMKEVARDSESGTVLFEDPEARSFASLPAVRRVPSLEAAEAALARADHRFGDTAVVVGSGPDQPAPGGTISARRPRPEQIEADVALAAPGTAVFAENCAHGWSARVDGRPAELTHADLALCAVPVEAGAHRVELDYTPPGWPWVWVLWALGLLVAWRWMRSRIRD